MINKVELLSPAGSYEGLIGTINAGADAIYLGGTRFSARANAANFDDESLIRAINLAHLFRRRIYLTLNTLIKEKEFSALDSYLGPLYEAGLDAVIIQDFGVLHWLRKNFPDLPVHASTQMNITHAYGAEFLRKAGVARIIPARELSLIELTAIRKKVDIELETFVHGAMCYSYSGRCLFSSMLGGRSGNRGRCAQPCRLPYHYLNDRNPKISNRNHEQAKNRTENSAGSYLLSLKDMCTLEILPDLIKAGIHSFKIEGRMKKPEYTAGVTAIYRKYIDLYYEKNASIENPSPGDDDMAGKNHTPSYQITAADRKMLESLYIRSEISPGYYLGKNKIAMITPEKPSYNSSDEVLLTNIRTRYLEKKLTESVNGKIKLVPFAKAELEITYESAGKSITITAVGEVVKEAKAKPLAAEMVNKQIRKTGATNFDFDRLTIGISDNVFVSVKELNALRRLGISLLEEELLKAYRRKRPVLSAQCETERTEASGTDFSSPSDPTIRKLHIKISTLEQWKSIMGNTIKNNLSTCFARIYVDIDLWKYIGSEQEAALGAECYAVLPSIIHSLDVSVWADYEKIVNHPLCGGVLVGNVEGYEWLQRIGYPRPIALDYSLYIWNREAFRFWFDRAEIMFYLPPELNSHELKEMLTGTEPVGLSVYGRIPLMYSANCVRRNAEGCLKTSGFSAIVDRYKKQFPVYHNCRQCYNIIYNSVPLSLHELIKSKKLSEVSIFRLDFTTETGREAKQIVRYFGDLINGRESALPYEDYTAGHIKRGVV